MPRVFWRKSGGQLLDDPSTAPIGKNVLTLTDVDRTDNYTCTAVSMLGNVDAFTTVEVRGELCLLLSLCDTIIVI